MTTPQQPWAGRPSSEDKWTRDVRITDLDVPFKSVFVFTLKWLTSIVICSFILGVIGLVFRVAIVGFIYALTRGR